MSFAAGYFCGVITYAVVSVIVAGCTAIFRRGKHLRAIKKALRELTEKRDKVIASGNPEQIEAFNEEVKKTSDELFP